MKRLFAVIMAVIMIFSLYACSGPDPKELRMDIYRGVDTESKLLHIVSNTQEKIDQMTEIIEALDLENAAPTDKTMDMLGFYPDYRIEVFPRDEEKSTMIVDISEDRVEFYFPEAEAPENEIIYLADISAEDFMRIINMTEKKAVSEE